MECGWLAYSHQPVALTVAHCARCRSRLFRRWDFQRRVRVYFTEAEDGAIYLRETSGSTKLLPESSGGGAAFQAASDDGSIAYFTKATTLYRYSVATDASQPIATEVGGVLAASSDAAYVYYLTTGGLFVWHQGSTTKVAAGADASNYPPATGTARVSADGSRLAFLSNAKLTGYENTGNTEVFLYDATSGHLYCPSCNPNPTAKPLGPSTIPGAYTAGSGPPAYRPRALTADGDRLFFDSSDKLLSVDTNKAADVYEWLAPAVDGCAKAQGCLGLISGGRQGRAEFLDASADGNDVFFRTDASLLPLDTGAFDVYDARAGGGFPEPPAVIPCEGDDCQGPPSAPNDPTPGTSVFEGPQNPPVHYPKVRKPRHHKKHSAKSHGNSAKSHGKHRSRVSHGSGG